LRLGRRIGACAVLSPALAIPYEPPRVESRLWIFPPAARSTNRRHSRRPVACFDYTYERTPSRGALRFSPPSPPLLQIFFPYAILN